MPGQPALRLKAWVTDRAAREIAKRAGTGSRCAAEGGARCAARKPVPLGIQASATIVADGAAEDVAERDRRAQGHEPAAGASIYTAHYDHFGMREPQPGDAPDADRIFNGAIDNASGLSGMLEIAQALARARTRPARSIYVLFTTAEESGLLGAEYFAAHPVLPASAWAANINIDSLNMAGPSRDIVLLGAERSTLGPMAAQLAARARCASSDPIRRPAAATSSDPIISRWRRSASRRCR